MKGKGRKRRKKYYRIPDLAVISEASAANLRKREVSGQGISPRGESREIRNRDYHLDVLRHCQFATVYCLIL